MSLRTKHLLIVLIAFIAEILIATTFSHFKFIRSFLGDFLVVMLLYHLVKAFREIPPIPLAGAVFLFSCLVEVSQYFHLADALGLERGSVLSILLGTSFSWGDIIMYFMGCVTSCFLDYFFLSKPERHSA